VAFFGEDSVKPYIELKGASGAVYRYKLAENGDPNTTIAGNYVYVDAKGTVVYVDSKTRWSEAYARYGATWLYTRLNVSGASRADEYSDIVIALTPVMNQAD
jgi:hypothetical protein